MKNKRLYSIYNGMKQRCNDSNHISYKYYGDKGSTKQEASDYISKNKDKLPPSSTTNMWALVNGY